MSQTLDTLVTYFVSDEDDLLRGAKKSAQAVTRFGVSARKTLNSVGKSFVRVGKVAAVAIAATAITVAAASIKLASDAEETQQKFSVVFSSIAGDAEDMAKDLQKNYGLARTESKELLSGTADLLSGFGFTQEASLDLSVQVQKLAVDLASFSNFSGGAKGASEALTKALLGERESVKALGIAILEEDVKKEVAIMTAKGLTFETERQAKAYATLNIAIRQSQNAIGDFERSQGSFANQTRILRANITNIAEDIGKTMLPIVTEWVTVLNRAFILVTEGSDAAKRSSNAFADSFVKDGSTIGKAAEELVETIATPFIFLQLKMLEGRRGILEFRKSWNEFSNFFVTGGEKTRKRLQNLGLSLENMAGAGARQNIKELNQDILDMSGSIIKLERALEDPVGAAQNLFKTIKDEVTAASDAIVAAEKNILLEAEILTEQLDALIGDVGASTISSVEDTAKATTDSATDSANTLKDTIPTAIKGGFAKAQNDINSGQIPPLDFAPLLGTGFLGIAGAGATLEGLGQPQGADTISGQLTLGGPESFLGGGDETAGIGERGFGVQGLAALMATPEFRQEMEFTATAVEEAAQRIDAASVTMASSMGATFGSMLTGAISFRSAFTNIITGFLQKMIDNWIVNIQQKLLLDQVSAVGTAVATAPHPFLIPAFVSFALAAFSAAMSSSGGSQWAPSQGGGGSGGGSSMSSLSDSAAIAPQSQIIRDDDITELGARELNITLTDENNKTLMSWMVENTRNGIGDDHDVLALA